MAIDLQLAFDAPPPKLDFIWSGFLSGTVGALIAPGATGKSFWALQAAMSVACASCENEAAVGGDLLGISPYRGGKVIYLAGEDPVDALMNRVHLLGKYLPEAARSRIAKNLVLESILGSRLNLMDEATLDRSVELWHGARLIVLDTLSRIHCCDENSNGEMARLISTLEFIASSTGASVLFLHHVSKGSTRDGLADKQLAARGASALIDNSRWCGFMAKMSEQEAGRLCELNNRLPIGESRRGNFVRFGVCKQNYEASSPDCWYTRHEAGVLMPVNLSVWRESVGRKRSYA